MKTLAIPCFSAEHRGWRERDSHRGAGPAGRLQVALCLHVGRRAERRPRRLPYRPRDRNRDGAPTARPRDARRLPGEKEGRQKQAG